jgi:hypothetical protein
VSPSNSTEEEEEEEEEECIAKETESAAISTNNVPSSNKVPHTCHTSAFFFPATINIHHFTYFWVLILLFQFNHLTLTFLNSKHTSKPMAYFSVYIGSIQASENK